MRQKLRAERLDPIRHVGEALFHPPETLLVLGESAIDALESFEHLTPNLLHPDHCGRGICQERADVSFQLSASGFQLVSVS